MIQISETHKALILPYDQRIAQAVPTAKDFIEGGVRKICLRHGESETYFLRNLGYNVPAPILHHYNWNGDKPFHVQKVTAALLSMSARAYVLNEVGSGKTRAALHAANWLIQTGAIRKVLVVAPLSCLKLVWEREIFLYFHLHSSVIVHGSPSKRKAAMEADHSFYIINPSGLKSTAKHIMARDDIDLIIIDESTQFKNKQTDRWKALKKISTGVKGIWAMTGTPAPNAPTEAWAQIMLVTPNNVPPSFRQFRELTMLQQSQYRWIPKHNAPEIVHNAMQPSVRFSRDECIDLPPTLYTDRYAPLSKLQDDFYKEMIKQLKVQVQSHKVTAANEGIKLSKLLQICTGYVYTTDGKVLGLSPSPRFTLLEELIEEAEHKVIVFTSYEHATHAIYQDVLRYSTAEIINGSVPLKQRNETFTRFMNAKDPHVLVAHPGTMSHGLTLTEASTIIWFSPPYSLETYLQANGRITRPGQKRSQLIVHIQGSPVERQVYRRLQERDKVQGVLLSLFKNVDEAA